MSATAHPSTFRYGGHSAPYGVEVSSIVVMVYDGVDQGCSSPDATSGNVPSAVD